MSFVIGARLPKRSPCAAPSRCLHYWSHPRPHNSQGFPVVIRQNLRYGARKASSATTTETASEAKVTNEVKPPSSSSSSSKRRPRRLLYGTSLLFILGFGYLYATDTRASAHRWIVPPLLRWLYPDAEDAHHVGVDWLKTLYYFGLHPRERGNPDGSGELITQVA